ncbi:MAG: hypothetical protein U9N86_13230 [Bacteroidota bacterium]|nr:hypothetical protein [Bacteroidota bacterium]
MIDNVLQIAIIGAGTRGTSLATHINNNNNSKLAKVVAIAETRSEARE